MYSVISTAVLDGIHTIPVSVEVDICEGLPMFEMVGCLSSEVKEAKERVRTALHHCRVCLPAKRVTINLSPGNIRKSGTGFDLPIAVAMLCSLGIVDEKACSGKIFFGELSLKGQILAVNGILPIISDGMERGSREFVVPKENLSEGTLVGGASVYGFSDLQTLIGFLNGEAYEPEQAEDGSVEPEMLKDFSEVNGQLMLKRACEVSAAGMHNLLMIGPPGAGKTMVAERVCTILPPLQEDEKLELSKIYSVCGLFQEKKAFISQRPFRNPHHTITPPGLTGGGRYPKPGEISLAHHGVLFLDELTEFQKSTLEILRQPLESHEIHLVRSGISVTYPADFLFMAAMNKATLVLIQRNESGFISRYPQTA